MDPQPEPLPLGSPPTISVVFPAFDEEGSIGPVLEQARAFLAGHFADYEILVVDDGSGDATAAVVRAFASAEARIHLLRHPRRLGYGAALRTGFLASRMELVFFSDADGQFDIRELEGFLPLLASADAVFGFRVGRVDGRPRRFLSWGYNRLVRAAYGLRLRDVDCSFKLFRRGVVEALELECGDFFIDTEIAARTIGLGFRVEECGVRHYKRLAGRSSVRPIHIACTLLTGARMWPRLRRRSAAGQRSPAAS